MGKTDFAIDLAARLSVAGVEAVAVSADAFQVYRGLETLSGAPSPAQRKRLEHLLVADRGVDESMSAGRLAVEARAAIDEILERDGQPIVIGGSGLYMQAVLTELPMRPPLSAAMQARAGEVAGAPPEERERLLTGLSAQAAELIDSTDGYRAGRAVALGEAGGDASPGTGFWESPLRRKTLLFGLLRDREELYGRIDRRVDRMVDAGAAADVARLDAVASATARQVIGFEELPEGRIDDMKSRTRRYAKRQLTWMRRMQLTETFDLSSGNPSEAAAAVARAALAGAQ